MNWFIGLLVIGVGSLLVIRTQWIYDFTGPIDWAEQHLGTEGGTRLFIKLIGVLFIIGAFLGVTGILGNWVAGFFGGFMKV
jgi:predicted small integral membrane protein